jgi:hypothetical protein
MPERHAVGPCVCQRRVYKRRMLLRMTIAKLYITNFAIGKTPYTTPRAYTTAATQRAVWQESRVVGRIHAPRAQYCCYTTRAVPTVRFNASSMAEFRVVGRIHAPRAQYCCYTTRAVPTVCFNASSMAEFRVGGRIHGTEARTAPPPTRAAWQSLGLLAEQNPWDRGDDRTTTNAVPYVNNIPNVAWLDSAPCCMHIIANISSCATSSVLKIKTNLRWWP